MAKAATGIWEVRLAGNDTQAGYFNPARGGVDYSQQNGAQLSVADGVANGTTTITSATGGFTAAMVGNGINIAGTVYEITAFTNTNTITVDTAVLTASGLTMKVGGAIGTVGFAGAGHVGGNTIWTNGSPVTSATANITGGCLSLLAGTTALATKLLGYSAARGDGGQAAITPSAISTFTLVTCAGAGCILDSLNLNGGSLTSSRGLNGGTTFNSVRRCKLSGFTNGAILNFSSQVLLCEVTGCSTVIPVSGCLSCVACVSHDNTITPWQGAGGSLAAFCASINNSGASTDGFNPATSGGQTLLGCHAYGNGRHGFNSSPNNRANTYVGCRSEKNGGFGYTASITSDQDYLYNCSGWNNTSGNVGPNIVNNIGFLTLTGDPSVNAAGLNFALNLLPGAGAALRAAGIPAAAGLYSLPGLNTPCYPDLGPSQHADPATLGYSAAAALASWAAGAASFPGPGAICPPVPFAWSSSGRGAFPWGC